MLPSFPLLQDGPFSLPCQNWAGQLGLLWGLWGPVLPCCILEKDLPYAFAGPSSSNGLTLNSLALTGEYDLEDTYCGGVRTQAQCKDGCFWGQSPRRLEREAPTEPKSSAFPEPPSFWRMAWLCRLLKGSHPLPKRRSAPHFTPIWFCPLAESRGPRGSALGAHLTGPRLPASRGGELGGPRAAVISGHPAVCL